MQSSNAAGRSEVISYFCAFTFVVLMVALSEIYIDREIILPEVSAMAVALWVYRDQRWMMHPEKIFLWPTATALLGFGINILSIPFFAKLALVLGGMLMFFLIFRYSLAPALATGFLPVVTDATGGSFLISILVTTLILMLVVMVFGLRTKHERLANVRPELLVVYALIVLVSIVGASWLGYPHLAVLPPVAVVVYEALHAQMYSWKVLLKQTMALTVAAIVGVAAHWFFDDWLVVALVCLPLMWLVLWLLGMRMPAVYAFPLLVSVFPQHAVVLIPMATLLVTLLSLSLVLSYHVVKKRRSLSMPSNM